jgi:hypothetical protein
MLRGFAAEREKKNRRMPLSWHPRRKRFRDRTATRSIFSPVQIVLFAEGETDKKIAAAIFLFFE